MSEKSNRINLVSKKQRLLKRFLDSRWAWNIIQGPLYNRLIFKAASELYQHFIGEIQPPKNARILDIGSGPGFVTLALAQGNPTVSVIGIDYSLTQVQAANRLRIRNQTRNCVFKQGDSIALPFKDASFDIVISLASITHWSDAKKGLQEIWRVLIPNGFAFIGEKDRDATDEEIHQFAGKFTAWYVWDRFMRWYLHRIAFGQSLSRKETESIARAAGFGHVFVEKVLGLPYFFMKLRK